MGTQSHYRSSLVLVGFLLHSFMHGSHGGHGGGKDEPGSDDPHAGHRMPEGRAP